MKIKPLSDYILVDPKADKDSKTASGILLPETAKEKPQEGKVVAVGAGKIDDNGNLIKPQVKVGDKVYYKKWGGTEIKLDNKELILIKGEDILASIE